jgi:peroxiredoxin
MLELGTQAPDFKLPNPVSNTTVSRSDFNGTPLLVVFACNHCPFVLHILHPFVDFTREYQSKGVSIVMINSNDVENYADDSPQKMALLSREYNFNFDYLFDETQEVASAYRAACTPDFFLFDDKHRLVYRGQFDDSRPGNDSPVNGHNLREAADNLLKGKPLTGDQKPSLGCNIKWKAGKEPDYS